MFCRINGVTTKGASGIRGDMRGEEPEATSRGQGIVDDFDRDEANEVGGLVVDDVVVIEDVFG